ncbi:predicted protein [Botrytis cinerea T4]|uniref:Uncharacterized protein n=1 Tax=Botryotinia fuckeliana (strain T4) TaxID=999810 RepID=G2YQT1_BOTF4|nr:predicted protein [Botrytis cinerea T4]
MSSTNCSANQPWSIQMYLSTSLEFERTGTSGSQHVMGLDRGGS